MNSHATPEDLARYLEGVPDAPEWRDLAAHLRTCRECESEYLLGLDIRERRLAGFLPEKGVEALTRRVRELAGAEPRRTETGSFLGLLAATFTGTPGAPAALPTLAASRDDDAVRSADADASIAATGHDAVDWDPASHHGESHMTPIAQPDPMIGPGTNLSPDSGQQAYQDTCAVRCQEYIIERWTGVDLPQEVYRNEAMANGWYTDGGGTTPDNVGNLLEAHGIPVNRYEHGNIFNLTSELAQGHQVIIGVNAEHLWEKDSTLHNFLDHFRGHGADHAVMVSGIDTSDPAHVQVILSDPGSGEPAAKYPLERFLEAWKASDFFMVATQDPAPENMHLPEMANFNYDEGHISHIGDLTYDQFLDLSVNPYQADADAATGIPHATTTNPADDFDAKLQEFLDHLSKDQAAGHHVIEPALKHDDGPRDSHDDHRDDHRIDNAQHHEQELHAEDSHSGDTHVTGEDHHHGSDDDDPFHQN